MSVVHRVKCGVVCTDVALRRDGAVVAVLGIGVKVVIVLRRRSDGQYEECQRIGTPRIPHCVAISPSGTIVCGDAFSVVYECGGGVGGVYEETQRLHDGVGDMIFVNDSVLITVYHDLSVYGRTAADAAFEAQQRLPAVFGGEECRRIAVSSDGGAVVVGSYGGIIAFVERSSVGVCEVRQIVAKAHRGDISALSFVPNGNVVSGSVDGCIKVWSVIGGEFVALRHFREVHDGEYVRTLLVTCDGLLLSGGDDHCLRICGECLVEGE
jgi:WD40 repeat protein